jgi:glycosyltransferase involved in cell wall biosynthesis
MTGEIAISSAPDNLNGVTQKPRLLIIEPDYHAEVLATLCPILAERFALILWTTDKIWKKTGLQESLFACVLIMPKKNSIARFWQQHEHSLRSVDLVYFNTLEKYFDFFAGIEFPCPAIMRIHNANASLFPWTSINWSIGNIWNILSYLIRHVLIQRSWHYKKMLYQKMDRLMLPSAGVVAHLGTKAGDLGFHNISDYTLPFSSLGVAQSTPPGDTIVFAITGSVDAHRKDYPVLLQAIAQLKQRQPTQKLVMVLLGWAKGERAQIIIDEFLALTDEYFKLEYFRDYVSQQTFVQHMAKVHFLVAPIKLRTQYKIHLEYYGNTKISGIENDALCYRKPFILPMNYTLPPDLARVALAYDNANSLCDAMESMIKNDQWQKMAAEFDNLVNYQRSNIATNFHRLYQQLQSSHFRLASHSLST